MIGLNHRTAPIELRERLTFSHTHLDTILPGLPAQLSAEGVVLLSTCNRTELYLSSGNPQAARTQTLAGIKMALTTCAPNLDDKEAEDIAAGVLNNMKTMVGMTMNVAPTTPGAPDQLRLMNRLYLTAKLAPED